VGGNVLNFCLKVLIYVKGMKEPNKKIKTQHLRGIKVTPDLCERPPGKTQFGHHFEGKHGKLYLVNSAKESGKQL